MGALIRHVGSSAGFWARRLALVLAGSVLLLAPARAHGADSATLTLTAHRQGGSTVQPSVTAVGTPDFTLETGAGGVTVYQGTSAKTTVSVRRINNSVGNITFAASNLPAGVTAAFSPLVNDTTTLTLTAAADAPLTGVATTVTITGTPAAAGAGRTPESTTLPVAVARPFALSVDQNQLSLGQCVPTVAVTVDRIAPSVPSVALGIRDLPAGISPRFRPQIVSFLRGDVKATSVLTLTVTPGSPGLPDTTLTVYGRSGSLPEQTVPLRVEGACMDSDQDGIPDPTEALLLTKFRPYFLFSKIRFSKQGRSFGRDEFNLPMDPIEYLRHSRLRDGSDADAKVIRPWGAFAAEPSQLLAVDCSPGMPPSFSWFSTPGACASNLVLRRDRGKYQLDVDNHYRHGFNDRDRGGLERQWKAVDTARNIGLYGHVTRDQYGQYQIEYWQFYGYNETDAPFDVLDHEGDWESVKLVVGGTYPYKILAVYHYVHGKTIGFQMGPAQAVTIGNFVEWHGPNFAKYGTDHFDLYSKAGRAQNNLVRLYCTNLKYSGSCTHPMVYVEYGGHASWPSPYWGFVGAPDHGGDSPHRFIAATPPNLGEVEHPLSPEAEIIVRFDGLWGAYTGTGATNPPGPSLHKSWSWPAGDLQPCRPGAVRCIPESAFE